MNEITIEDFDRAVKQPFNPDTCILAQSALRLFNKPLYCPSFARAAGYGRNGMLLALSGPKSVATMHVFDCHFLEPGDENKPELQALRASLPIKL